MANLILWQTIITPHMLGLADAMVARGHTVRYAAVSTKSAMRSAMGWPQRVETRFSIEEVPTRAAAAALASQCSTDTTHLFQGIRGNRTLSDGLRVALDRKAEVWCILEKIDERGVLAWLRSGVYRWMLRRTDARALRLLAIGKGMREWLIRRGASPEQTYEFAYFLAAAGPGPVLSVRTCVRFAYVGQLIPRKRVDLLLLALSQLERQEYELEIIGDGPMKLRLQQTAVRLGISQCINWAGVQPMAVVRSRMAEFDRVILPSDHDGWGAVVSESLISGTPVICSDRCGAAAAVVANEMGTVIRHGDCNELKTALEEALAAGPIPQPARDAIRQLAKALTAEAGAEYLEALLHAAATGTEPPLPPWTALGSLPLQAS